MNMNSADDHLWLGSQTEENSFFDSVKFLLSHPSVDIDRSGCSYTPANWDIVELHLTGFFWPIFQFSCSSDQHFLSSGF